MTIRLEELFPEKLHPVLNSILPGGNRWHEKLENIPQVGCLENCPFYGSCRGHGPSQKLCSDDWGKTPAKTNAWMVLKHIFDNFHYYNCGDLAPEYAGPLASEISEILDFPFESGLSSSEALAIVKVRLKQAEFKANLFALWEGCSIEGLEIAHNFLIASHIKPWAQSSDLEKVSQYNGLLLPTNYDYLFDRHLISFSPQGTVMLHSSVELKNLYGVLGIDHEAHLRPLHETCIQFLSEHNKRFQIVGEKMSNNALHSDVLAAASRHQGRG